MKFLKLFDNTLDKFRQEAEKFEELGYETMIRLRDRAIAEEVCGLKLHAYNDRLRTLVESLENDLHQCRDGIEALACFLYQRDQPVQDARMFAQEIKVGVLIASTILAAVISLVANTAPLWLMGSTWAAVPLGLAFSGLAVITGYLAFERLSGNKLLQGLVIALATILAAYGFVEWAQSRTIAISHLEVSDNSATSSYVEGGTAELEQQQPQARSDEEEVRTTRQRSWMHLLLAADLFLGILLACYMRVRTDEVFSAWKKLKSLRATIDRMKEDRESLLSFFEIAKKLCMAGILNALHTPKKKHIPYFRSLPLIILVVLLFTPAWGQDFNRQEGILLDISGSIGGGAANNDLFYEYLHGTKRLLETEPPNSKVIVSVITTDSFGSVRELLKGWTPEAHGIFTDDLARARQQLAASFVAKSATLTPIAAGTDIIGGIWKMKASMESGSKERSIQREIWIASDMLNETAAFPMPAMLGLGRQKMIEHVKANGLLLSLKGYKIHVVGASTRGLTPQAWTTVKDFWEEYFREAGADLVSYSMDLQTR